MPADVWPLLDACVERAGRPGSVLLTQAAHARSAGDVAARDGAAVWGHEPARGKLGGATFRAVEPGDEVPGEAALPFDADPGTTGTPFSFTAFEAAAMGDVFISRDDGLHLWWGHGGSLESLRSWLELPLRHLLIAHGPLAPPSELQAALERPPDRVT